MKDMQGDPLTGDRLVRVLAALANPHRIRILAALAAERVHVSGLARQVGLSRPLVSPLYQSSVYTSSGSRRPGSSRGASSSRRTARRSSSSR